MLSIVLYDRDVDIIFHGFFLKEIAIMIGEEDRESSTDNNTNTVRKVGDAKRQIAGLTWHSS